MANPDRYDDLHLADDPYLIECARWRATLGDKPSAPRPRPTPRADVGLCVVVGLILALLLVHWLAR